MRLARLLGILLLSAPILPAAGQITFDGSLLHTLVGQQVTGTVYSIQATHFPSLGPIVNATGGNQTYDFTPYTYDVPSITSYTALGSAAGTPGESDPYLNTANFVQVTTFSEQSASYVYNEIRDDGYFLLGSVFTSEAGMSISKFEPADETYALPLTTNSAWSETYTLTSEGFGSTSSVELTDDEAVDGWGTLVTPLGSAPVLRLKKVHTQPPQAAKNTDATVAQVVSTAYIFVSNELLGAVIIVDAEGNVLSAAYTITRATSTAVEDIPEQPFHLAQNHPNPFRDHTTITYAVRQPGHVRLRVYDVLGRTVATLVDQYQLPGDYRTTFSPDGLTGGLYLYALETGDATAVRPLVLLR